MPKCTLPTTSEYMILLQNDFFLSYNTQISLNSLRSYPFFKDYSNPPFSNRYFDSLKTTDQYFSRLFQILEKTGHSNNTIIIGSGDHGEDPFKSGWVRVSALDSNVLHTVSYMHYPKHLMGDASVAERLRNNTQKLTHILDIYPTIQNIINSERFDALQHFPDGCITGLDLTSVDIPDDRVTLSINLASSNSVISVKGKKYNTWSARLWSLSTVDSKGRELTLYHRKNKYPHPELQQGMDNVYVLEFGNCTRNISSSNLCMEDGISDKSKLETFSRAIHWLEHTPYYHEGVKNSELVELFRHVVYVAIRNITSDDLGRTPELAAGVKTLKGWGWVTFGLIVCFRCGVHWKVIHSRKYN